MDQVFLDIYQAVWKEIFPNVEIMDLEKFKELYTKDLRLPKKYESVFDHTSVYALDDYGYKRFITEDEVKQRNEVDNFMKQKTEIIDLKDLLNNVGDVATFRGSRTINSDVVEESDSVYSSSYIFNSAEIRTCQKMVFCHGNKDGEYLAASRGNAESTFGIRLFDDGGVSNSFEVHWSGKSSNCYFCSNCFDLRDCMFCFNIVSKQYCIGNMQFEEAEYKQLKEKLIKEYFAQIDQLNAFRLLRDL
jgi:hypothetical protein